MKAVLLGFLVLLATGLCQAQAASLDEAKKLDDRIYHETGGIHILVENFKVEGDNAIQGLINILKQVLNEPLLRHKSAADLGAVISERLGETNFCYLVKECSIFSPEIVGAKCQPKPIAEAILSLADSSKGMDVWQIPLPRAKTLINGASGL